jgi:hypothetical protein
MKNFTFLKSIGLLILAFIFCQSLQAQTYTGSITLASQAEVDAFGANNYTGITGTLTVQGADIIDLSSLNTISILGSNLIIKENNILTSLNGLQQLVSVGGGLNIVRNNALTDLSGLQNIPRLNYFDITGNTLLATIDGISTISVDGDMTINSNQMLSNLNGLPILNSTLSYLQISGNAGLTSLDGLENLSSLNGILKITSNENLTGFCELYPLLSSGGLSGLYVLEYNAVNPTQQEIIDGGSCDVEPVTTIGAPNTTECGTMVVPVTVSDFTNVGTVSLKLNYDATKLAYQSVDINSLVVGASSSDNVGLFSMGYFGDEVSLDDDEVLFTLYFDILPTATGTVDFIWDDAANTGNCEYAAVGADPVYSSTFNDLTAVVIPTRPVNNTTQSTYYCTIQEAIDAANSGDDILVSAGTYDEFVTIDKSLVLRGANALVDPTVAANGRVAGTLAGESVIDGPILVDANVSNVDVFGFYLAYDGTIILTESVSVYLNNNVSDITFTNNIFEDSDYAIGATVPWGSHKGIITSSSGSSNITISSNLIAGYESAVYLNPAAYNVVLSDNKVLDCQYGFRAISTQGLEITDNTFEGSGGLQLRAGWAAGAPAISGLVIEDNSFDNIVSGYEWVGYVANWDPNLTVNLVGMGNSFDGKTIAAMSYPADFFTLENYIVHAMDDAGYGLVITKTDHLFANPTPATLGIQRGIDAASTGFTVNVSAGTYAETVSVNKDVTLLGANVGLACGSRGAESLISGSGGAALTVTSDGVTIDGFEITNPAGNYAIAATGRNDLTIQYNNINNIGTLPVLSGNTHAVSIAMSSTADIANVTVKDNCFSNIQGGENSSLSGTDAKSNNGSASAIAVGWSNGAYDITGLLIEGNEISNVEACDNEWLEGGKGAYGIIINIGSGLPIGKAVNPVVQYNTISNLYGFWAHGIGLEGETPGAVVQLNTIDNLTCSKTDPIVDATGIMVEENDGAASLDIHNNSFTSMSYGVINVTTGLVDATCNWYGTDDYNLIFPQIYGNVTFVNYLTDADILNPTCEGEVPPVQNVTQNLYYYSIQEAIDAASTVDDDIIEVQVADFTEPDLIRVTKSLTIQGLGKTATIVRCNVNTSNGGHTDDGAAWILGSIDKTMTLKNMTLDASGKDVYYGVRFRSGGELDNVAINGIVPSTAYTGIAVQVLDGNLDVTNCTLTNIGRVGIHYRNGIIAGATISGTVDGLNYTGKGTGTHLDYAVEISGGVTVTVKNSTIHNNLGIVADDAKSAAIYPVTYFPSGAIPNAVTISNNTLYDNYEGVQVGYDANDVSVVTITNNKIYDNTYGVLSWASQVNAIENWWGDASGPLNDPKNLCGLGNEVSANVDFINWWTDEAMTTLSSLAAPVQTGGATVIASTVECIAQAIDPELPVVEDYCGTVLTPELAMSGDYVDCEGTKIYTYTYTDALGQTFVWTYTYTIDITTAPVVPVDGASTVQCLSQVVTPTLPVVTDVCGNNIPAVYVSTIDVPSLLDCEGTRTYTYSYTDCSSLESEWSFVYNIEHSTPPSEVAEIGAEVSTSSDIECESDDAMPSLLPVVEDVCGTLLTPDEGSPVRVSTVDDFGTGTITYTYTYTDCAGLEFVWVYTYNVEDVTPPIAVCQNLTVELDASGAATINYGDIDNGSSDNCGIETMSISKTSFSCTDVGDKTVTLTVTDFASQTTSCDAIVTVEDNIFPVALCKSLIINLDASGNAQITPAQVDNGSSDNCGVASVSLSRTNFDCSNVGANLVTFTATDASGNATTCEATITIQDITPPEITTEASAITQIVTVDCTAPMPDFTSNTEATDNCSVATITQSTAAGTFMSVGTHTVTVTATDPSGNTDFYEVEFIVTEATISGTVLYNNTAQTRMGNVTLKLTPGDVEVTTDVNDGTYEFTGLCAGTYTIQVTNNNKDVGYINSTDAGAANKWSTSPYSIEYVQFLAGDVNDDDYIYGASDALAIQNYFITNGQTPFTQPWAYWKAGQFRNHNNNNGETIITVIVNGANVEQDFYAMCTGDFNGSFEPDQTKSASSELVLITENNLSINENQEFELPLLANQTMEVGAVSMILDIPTDLVEVMDVNVIGSTEPVSWLMTDGELRIGWNSQNAVNVFADEALVNLKLKTTKDFTYGKFMEVDLVYDPLNELADGDFEVIDNVELIVAKVGNGLVVNEELTIDELNFKNYPNPFHNTTNISYALPVDGQVNISVYNQLGQLVTTLVDANQSTGEYTIRDCGSKLLPGIYIAKLRLTNEGVDRVGTIKLSVLE